MEQSGKMTEATTNMTDPNEVKHDEEEAGQEGAQEEVEASPEVHFEPVIKLEKEVEVKTHEEEETPLFKMRAKLFRFDKDLSEWKERGTGDVRLLQHKQNSKIRLVMRRDKTHKVCANHYLNGEMSLAPNVGSDRSWVYNVSSDFSEGESRQELLAIRFANAENANKFKAKFEECQKVNQAIADGKEVPQIEALPKEEKDESEPSGATEKKTAAVSEVPKDKETTKAE